MKSHYRFRLVKGGKVELSPPLPVSSFYAFVPFFSTTIPVRFADEWARKARRIPPRA